MTDTGAQYEILYFLRQRITELTTEVQCIVTQEGAENKPSNKLIQLIGEIEDLQGQLEFVQSGLAYMAYDQTVINLCDSDDEFEYEKDDDDEVPIRPMNPPPLERGMTV